VILLHDFVAEMIFLHNLAYWATKLLYATAQQIAQTNMAFAPLYPLLRPSFTN